MEKILQAIASLVEELKNKDNKILELERHFDAKCIECDDKDKKIKELEEEITKLKLEQIQHPCPLQPNPSNVPGIQPWPHQPSVPDWPYWPPYGPIITYVSTSDGSDWYPPQFHANW